MEAGGGKSDGPSCGFCGHGREARTICGTLHEHESSDKETTVAHHKCLQYSALLVQYKFDKFGGFKVEKVKGELKRAKRLKCSICKDRKKPRPKRTTGASAGCAYEKCSKTFHFYCAKQSKSALTKRMEKRLESGDIIVLYRVFCGPEHMRKYTESENDDLGKLEAMSDSDDTGDEEEQTVKQSRQSQNSSQESQSSTLDEPYPVHLIQTPIVLGTVKIAENVTPPDNNDDAEDCKPPRSNGTSSMQSFTSKRRLSGDSRGSSPALKKRKSSSPSTEADDLVICFSDVHDFDDVFTARAKSLFGVDEDKVHMWHGGPVDVSRLQMIWYMSDLVKRISNLTNDRSEFKPLYNIIFSLGEESLRKYDEGASALHLGEDNGHLEKNVIQTKVDDLRETLDKLNREQEGELAILLKETDVNTHVLYVQLSSVLDPDCYIRRTLTRQLFECDQDTMIENHTARTDISTSTEFTLLKEKLRRDAPSAKVFSYPCDDFLRVKQPDSACGRLFRHYTRRIDKQPNSKSLIVFIGPMNTEIVVYRLYIRQCMESVLRDHSSKSDEILFVFDVGPELGITNLSEMLPTSSENSIVTSWTAHDPGHLPVTCTIQRFEPKS